jgi:hypothetical protein
MPPLQTGVLPAVCRQDPKITAGWEESHIKVYYTYFARCTSSEFRRWPDVPIRSEGAENRALGQTD